MSPILYMPDNVEINATQERQAKAPMYGGGSSRPLGGRSGFRVGTPSDILTVTSTTWTLKPCSAQLDPGASTHQGMYGWASDADITGAIDPADATYARKDIIYIQVNDSTAGDGTAGTPSAPVLYLAGAATATPTAPGLPARSFLVGTIDVPKFGAGSPTVTLNPARFVAAGAPLPVSSQAERDALVPYEGLQVIRAGVTETYTGGAWTGLGSVDITTFGTGWTGLTGAHKPRLYRSGGMVNLVGGLSFGSTGGVGNMLTVPAAYRPANSSSMFVGVGVSSGGITYELTLNNGVLQVPPGYVSGTIVSGSAVPVTCSWPLY